MFFSRAAQVAVVVVSFLSVAGGFAVEQPANASGTVTVNGKATALHHAYAFHDQKLKGTLVLITDRAIDAAMLAEESAGFSSGATPSLRDLTKKGEVSGVELLVNGSNQVETVFVYNKAFDMPTPTSGPHFCTSRTASVPAGSAGVPARRSRRHSSNVSGSTTPRS